MRAPRADGPTVAAIRAAIDTAGYHDAGVRAAVGEDAMRLAGRGEPAPALRATRGGSPIETLVRLFALGVPVADDVAARALAPLGVAGWAAAGLVEASAGEVRAVVALRPVPQPGQSWVIAHDWLRGPATRADLVIGAGPASLSLAAFTVRPDVGAALDLGTGSGIQALFLAGHSRRVVATDREPRAAAFARFNLALNDVARAEVRTGDRFDPVAGERFDLIVSNPPFVISPDTGPSFRDSGLPLDAMCRSIVQRAGEHLAPGGWLQLMGSWPHVRGEAWADRLRTWVAGTGCDAWVIQRQVESPAAYAVTWIGQGSAAVGEAGGSRFDEWLDHYEAAGIEGFGYGLLTLRKVEGRAPWYRAEELAQDVAVPTGPAIALGFELADWLASHPGDDALLHARLVVSPSTRLDVRYAGEDREWAAERLMLQQVDGLRRSGLVDADAARAVAGCDGARPLRQVLAEAPAGPDEAQVRAALGAVRRLVAQGYLLPVELRTSG